MQIHNKTIYQKLFQLFFIPTLFSFQCTVVDKPDDSIVVAAASNLQFALKEIGDAYQNTHGIMVTFVWGASGKAILAYLPDETIHKALEQETAKAQNGASVPTFEAMQHELERFRKAGFGVSEGEKLIGARGVAAPVFGPNGILGSICMTSPMERIPVNRIAEFGEQIVTCARRISRSLGAAET